MISLSYSLKVWLSSVVIAPLIYSLASWLISINHFDPDSSIDLYPIMLLFELILSFCTWLAFWCITGITRVSPLNKYSRRLILSAAGIILTIGTFLAFSLITYPVKPNDIFFMLMLSNCLCIAVGCWFFKLESGSDVENGLGKINRPE